MQKSLPGEMGLVASQVRTFVESFAAHFSMSVD